MAYSKAGDPAGAAAGEDALKIRALLVDGVAEGMDHRRRARRDRPQLCGAAGLRLNDALARRQAQRRVQEHWVWQRGPWLLVDRATGHVDALKLPDYDPGVSQVSWFRDYGAYCGVTASGKSLYAVVAQVAARKPVLAKKLAAFDPESHADPVCAPPEWQREPLRVTFHPAGKDAVELRHRSRFGGAGGGRRRRAGDPGSRAGSQEKWSVSSGQWTVTSEKWPVFNGCGSPP